jgi:hypothetical protein
MKDLKEAYNDMHSEELGSWSEAQTKTVQKPGMKTLTAPKGSKSPVEPKTDSHNLRDRISESLWKGE